MKFFVILDEILDKASRFSLVACLFIILTLAVLAIVLRWLGSSVMWIEPLVRHLVFLSAFLGGSIATSKRVHIKVDLLTKLVDKSQSKMLKWFHSNLVSLFSFIVCILLMKSGWDFFLVEQEFGAPAFLNIHSSYLVGIIPLGIGLIGLRFLNQLMVGVLQGRES